MLGVEVWQTEYDARPESLLVRHTGILSMFQNRRLSTVLTMDRHVSNTDLIAMNCLVLVCQNNKESLCDLPGVCLVLAGHYIYPLPGFSPLRLKEAALLADGALCDFDAHKNGDIPKGWTYRQLSRLLPGDPRSYTPEPHDSWCSIMCLG